jgi:transposase, IS5 family
VLDLERAQWTGRKGYSIRSLLGCCIAKSLYAIPTWTRTYELVREHEGLQRVLGDCPSLHAMYRFAVKLRRHKPLLDTCLDRVTAQLRVALPEYGQDIAIDASDLPAYANGMRLTASGKPRERYSDPDASWGHRSAISTRKGGGFYGYKIHAAICARTDLPVAWHIRPARTNEVYPGCDLLRTIRERAFLPKTVTADKAYDASPFYEGINRAGALPVIPIKDLPTKNPPGPPVCEHGVWHYGGADYARKATKWRCPTRECQPASTWVKASRRDPLIPRTSSRYHELYRGRSAVEREFGRLKHHYGLAPLRVRGIERVRLHADLCMLARLSQALARARAVPLAA